MRTRLFLPLIVTALLTKALFCQQSTDADIRAYQQSCRIIKMTLSMREMHREPGDLTEDDAFTTAGKACVQFEADLSTSSAAKVDGATKTLRSVLAVLGMPPTSAQEQFAAAE